MLHEHIDKILSQNKELTAEADIIFKQCKSRYLLYRGLIADVNKRQGIIRQTLLITENKETIENNKTTVSYAINIKIAESMFKTCELFLQVIETLEEDINNDISILIELGYGIS